MKNLGYGTLDPNTLIKRNTTEYHLVDCSPDTGSKSGQVTHVTGDMVRELALKILDTDNEFDADFAEGVRSGSIPLRAAYIPIYYGHIDIEKYGYNMTDVKRRTIWKLDGEVIAKGEWKDGVELERENQESYSEEFGIPSQLDSFFGRNLHGRYRYSISCYHYGADPSLDQLSKLAQFNHPAAYQTYDVMLKTLRKKVEKEWGDSMTKEQKKAVDYDDASSVLYLFKVFYYEGDSHGTADAPFLAINAYEYFSGTYMRGQAGSSVVSIERYNKKPKRSSAPKEQTPRLTPEEAAGIRRYNREEAKRTRARGVQHRGFFSTVISFLMIVVFLIVNLFVDKSGIYRFFAVVIHVGVGAALIVALKKVDAAYAKSMENSDGKKAGMLPKLYALLAPVAVFVVLLIVTLIFAK